MTDGTDNQRYTRIQVWILACRPKTLFAALGPIIIGCAIALEQGVFDLLPALAAFLGAVAIQIGTNLANDYYDFKKGADSGKRLGPLRVTQAGLVDPVTMLRTTIMVFVLAAVFGVYLIAHAGWPILVIGVFSILFGVLYTAGPFPLAYNGLGDIFVLIFFGPVAVAGTHFVQTLQWNETAIIAGIAPGLFSVAILTVNNLRDIDNDRRCHKRTLAVRFGAQFAKSEYILSIIIASLIPIWLYLFHDGKSFAHLTLLVPIVAFPVFRLIYNQKGKILNKAIAGTGQLLLLYSILFSVGWLW